MEQELYKEIAELIENKRFLPLREKVLEMNSVDIAELIDKATSSEAIVIFRLLPKELAADAFSYMEPETRQQLIKVFTDKELNHIVNELYIVKFSLFVRKIQRAVFLDNPSGLFPV